MKKIKYFSGFANIGIGTTFAEGLGFECALANELDLNRADWLQMSYPKTKVVQGNFTDRKIFKQLVDDFKSSGCELAIFSPCCQPFSRAGGQHLNSPEAFLFLDILEFIKQAKPKWAWIENAKEFPKSILNDDPRTIEERITTFLTNLGYDVNFEIQDAADFGTPQHRRRSICLISNTGHWEFPKKNPNKKPLTVRQATGHLPSVEAGKRSGIPFHNGPRLPKYQADCMIGVPDGKWSLSPVSVKGEPASKPKPKHAFRRIYWDRPCNTIVQKSSSISGFQTVHPKDNRTLTILEIILLGGLPENWKIPLPYRFKEDLIRDVLGEMFAPRHVAHLLKQLLKIVPK